MKIKYVYTYIFLNEARGSNPQKENGDCHSSAESFPKFVGFFYIILNLRGMKAIMLFDVPEHLRERNMY